jgi:transposase
MLLKSILMNKTGEKSTKKQNGKTVNFQLVNPNAAGIDIGDTLHAVAVPEGRDEVCVKEFGTFTADLLAIADWLKNCRIETVAMESTGVYWKNLCAVLISEGFEVYLVNARHTKNISGKKTDESDAQWIQKLHSCSLLSSSFLPDDQTDCLRTLVRYRRKLTQDSSTCVLRMQKALELMNLKIHTLISDLMGKTGTAIVEAILAGERTAENFLRFVDVRIKADKTDIVKSLEGNWRREHLFLLEQNYQNYLFLQGQIMKCDQEIEQVLQLMHARENEGIVAPEKQVRLTPKGKVSKQKKDKNQPFFDTEAYLKGIHKIDVLDIYGLQEISALEILSETGTDLSKWETAERFISWLNLCPNSKKTGGKLFSSKLLKKKPNAAAKAFRMAAQGVQNSDNWLGHFFRRMKTKGGHKYAIVATARKIAVIYYKMVSEKKPFDPLNYNDCLEKYKMAKIACLQRALDKLKQQVA